MIKGHYSTYGICGKWREREVHTCSMSVCYLELSPLTSVVTRHVPISSGITLNNLGVISLSCYFQHLHWAFFFLVKRSYCKVSHNFFLFSNIYSTFCFHLVLPFVDHLECMHFDLISWEPVNTMRSQMIMCNIMAEGFGFIYLAFGFS